MSKKDKEIERLKAEILYLKSGNVKDAAFITFINKQNGTYAMAINIKAAQLSDTETVIVNGQSFVGYNYRLSTKECQRVVDGFDEMQSINWSSK